MKIIKIEVSELFDNFDWEKVCEVKGFNPYCVNEGLLLTNEKIDFTIDEYLKLIGREKDIKYFR